MTDTTDEEKVIKILLADLDEINIGFVAAQDAPEEHDKAIKVARAALQKARRLGFTP